MKNFLGGKICLTLVTILKIKRFLMRLIKKDTGKMKDEFRGAIVDKFVGLKSKMHSMKEIDGKECNTGKGVNIATELMN